MKTKLTKTIAKRIATRSITNSIAGCDVEDVTDRKGVVEFSAVDKAKGKEYQVTVTVEVKEVVSLENREQPPMVYLLGAIIRHADGTLLPVTGERAGEIHYAEQNGRGIYLLDYSYSETKRDELPQLAYVNGRWNLNGKPVILS